MTWLVDRWPGHGWIKVGDRREADASRPRRQRRRPPLHAAGGDANGGASGGSGSGSGSDRSGKGTGAVCESCGGNGARPCPSLMGLAVMFLCDSCREGMDDG